MDMASKLFTFTFILIPPTVSLHSLRAALGHRRPLNSTAPSSCGATAPHGHRPVQLPSQPSSTCRFLKVYTFFFSLSTASDASCMDPRAPEHCFIDLRLQPSHRPSLLCNLRCAV